MTKDLGDLPSLELGGLDHAASIRLLTSGRPALSMRVAAALHEAARGNPLAMVEIPTLLNDAQRSGVEALPDPLPAGPHLELAFLRRASVLPEPVRRALLLAAASESTDIGILRRALEHLEMPARSLEPAEVAGLISVDGAEVRFRHPLIRSAIYHAADPVARREAHRALAASLDAEQDGDRRAWHLAAACAEPDESVASALEDAAIRSMGRSGYGSAGTALMRSASLSPSSFERARRLLAGAGAFRLAGRPAEASHLLDEAIALHPPERMRFQIEHLRAGIEMWVGMPMAAHNRLLIEANRAEHRDPAGAAVLLAEATMPCFMAGDLRRGLATAKRAQVLADRVGTLRPLIVDAVLTNAMVLCGTVVEASMLIDDCLGRVRGPEAAQAAQCLAHSLTVSARHMEARAILETAVASARTSGAVGLLPYALSTLSELEFRTGNFAAAYAGGTEAVRLAGETGQGSTAAYSLMTLARVEAAQGRDEACRTHTDAAIELARIHGLDSIFQYGGAALGLLDLGRGRPGEALVHLEETAKLSRELGPSNPNILQWAPDYIESLARAGRTDDATRELEALELDAERTDGAWARAAAARCRGFTAQDGSTPHFLRALELHEASPSPFEVARTQLCYGEVLRRQRQRVEARKMLREALVTFEKLGAEPWANRARTELAATGEKARKRDVAATRQLTPQELQISLAVAQGATNREVAAQLFLSPKTVEAHLSRVYRKLGVRSRTELTRIFANETTASVPSKATTRLK
jgi:DNA-binding CsgD family transcriptional regulator